MKKLLGLTLALALLVPAGASAELLKNFKMGGSLEVDGVSARNVASGSSMVYDKISTIQTRLIVKSDWDMLEDVRAHISITKSNRTYGSGPVLTVTGVPPAYDSTIYPATPLGVGTVIPPAGETLTAVQGSLFVQESYVKIENLFGSLETTVGRQFYGEPGDLVIYYGPKYNFYGMPVTALDGVRFDWSGENIGVTALGAKLVGSGVGAIDSGNVNLQGINVHVKASDNMSGTAYLYSKTQINSGIPSIFGVAGAPSVVANDHLYVLGFKSKMTMGNAWIKGEIAKDFGSERIVATPPFAPYSVYSFSKSYTGTAAKIDGGLKTDLSLGSLNGWGEAGIGSGGATTNRNFHAIAGDYRPGDIIGRFPGISAYPFGGGAVYDPTTLSNLVVLGLGAKVTPTALKKLTAGLSIWNFRTQTSAGLPAAMKGNKFLGNEYDLDLSWAHSENVTIDAGVADFQLGKGPTLLAVAASGSSSPVRMMYADMSVKF